MEFLWFIGGYLTALITTIVVVRLVSRRGKYLIDRRNPEKETHKLDFGDPLELTKKKYLVLKIDYNADLTQN